MSQEALDTAQSQADLTKSAQRLEDSADVQADSADRRTQLAADRTVLAAERTYAAWVRTGLAALASGVGVRALLKDLVPDWLGLATACLLVLFAGFCFLAAVWREMMRIAPPRPDARRLPPGLLVAVNGFLLLVCLAALAGIWVQ
jgi:putative membrane protein